MPIRHFLAGSTLPARWPATSPARPSPAVLCCHDPRRDECPEQGVLAGMLPVLEAVQGRVAAAAAEARGGGSGGSEPHGPEGGGLPPTDVRRALREQRRQVLAGVHIVFSRLFPNARRAQGAAGQQEGAHGEQDDVEASHPLWLLAQSCGAVCSTQCSEETTHVVASCAETDKVG